MRHGRDEDTGGGRLVLKKYDNLLQFTFTLNYRYT